MIDKLNQFISNLNGQFVEVSDNSNEYQCMDLVYLWVYCLGYPKATIQHLYAYEAFTKPTDITYKYFDLISNTPDFIPNDGDICVFKGGVAGHIAICLGGGTTTKFKRFEQNNPLGTHAAVNERGYTNMLGVLRPKILAPTEPVIYKGYDITNQDSMKVAVDVLVDLQEGQLVRKLDVDKIISDGNQKLVDAATSYEKEKAILTTQISTLETALKTLQDTEHTWENQADVYQRKLKAIVDIFATVDIQLAVESDVAVLVGTIHDYIANAEANGAFVTRILSDTSLGSPEAVLDTLQTCKLNETTIIELEKQITKLQSTITSLKNKQPTVWQFIINKYFTK